MPRLSRFGALLAIICAVVVAVAAVARATPIRTDMAVSILRATDAQGLGRPNVLELSVTNRGTVAVQPVFAVQWDHYPFVWNGPSAAVAPNETRRVVITTDNYEAMPPLASGTAPDAPSVRSVPFVVRVNNAGDVQYWASAPWTAQIDRPAIVNGHFDQWLPPDFSDHGRTPVGWDNYSSGQLPDLTLVKPDLAGLALEVSKSAGPQSNEWGEAAVAREISVDACPALRVQFANWPDYLTSDGVLPVLMGGVQVFADDAPGRSLLEVPSQGTLRYVIGNGMYIWEQPPIDGSLVVDLAQARTLIAAGQSPTVRVKLFLAIHRSSPTLRARMAVRAVDCLAS
ncbi:MAG TPA: hypothetical protein VK009_30245 [Chloroflexota bacterium]|nr:hypothetical protein [Chloroflexota bacterium]